jgi:putative membrane protein
MKNSAVACAIALALGCGWAGAQAAGGTSDVPRADRKFIEDAAGDGMYEVQAAQLAQSKAQSPEVKSFASKMADDHQQANNELVQIANARHLELPAGPPRGKRHEVETFAKKSGADFDKTFIAASIKDHEKDIKQFEKASANAKDPQLKAWIDKTLPHLREHLAMAQKLQGASMGNR